MDNHELSIALDRAISDNVERHKEASTDKSFYIAATQAVHKLMSFRPCYAIFKNGTYSGSIIAKSADSIAVFLQGKPEYAFTYCEDYNSFQNIKGAV